MSQTLTSPVPKWPGTVQIPDYLTFPQMLDFQASIEAAQALKDASRDQYNKAILPGICACVEAWALKGLPEHLTPDNFPATPKVSSIRLITWLMGEIIKLYQEADEAPKRVTPAVYDYMAGYTQTMPRELRLALMVNRYGTVAVFGNREIPAKDILAMNAANNVYNAWQAKQNCRDEKGRYSSGLFHKRFPTEEKLLYQLESLRRKHG